MNNQITMKNIIIRKSATDIIIEVCFSNYWNCAVMVPKNCKKDQIERAIYNLHRMIVESKNDQ